MKQHILPTISFIFIIFIWQVAVMVFNIPKWILPGPGQIILSFWEGRSLFIIHILPTVFEALIGLLFAIILGVLASILMKLSETLRKILYPFLILSQTIPFITLAPLLTIWFGFGLTPKVMIVTLVCFFPIALNLFDGFNCVDPAIIRLFDSMGASKLQKIKLIFIPASLPSFFSGLKIAGSYCILGAVVSEWIGAQKGLGILLVRSSKSYLTERVFATIAVITFLSLILVFSVRMLETVFIPWHYKKGNEI